MTTFLTLLRCPDSRPGLLFRSPRHLSGTKATVGFAACCVLALAARPAHAQVSYVSGAPKLVLKQLVAPLSVVPRVHASNTTVWWFAENKRVTVPNQVGVVLYKNYLKVNGATPGVTLAGKVNSYMIFTSNATGKNAYDMTVYCAEKVLGVIVKARGLDATDRFLGLWGTRYPYLDAARGLDKGGPDYMSFGADGHTLTIHTLTVGNVDEIRVLTAPATR